MMQEGFSARSPQTLSGSRHATDTRQVRIFVPVDFSKASFDSLEYALNLAKTCQGCIDLFHITDAGELYESDNAIVINRLLDRLETKANAQNESLKEMIEESGVPVMSCEFVIGHPIVLLQKKIEQLSPDLVVINKNKVAGHGVDSIIRSVKVPVLVMPDTIPPSMPAQVVLFNDSAPIRKDALATLFRIVQRTTRDLTVLSFYSGQQAKGDDSRLPINGYEINVGYINHQSDDVLRGVASYVKAHDVDLFCLVAKRQSWWQRIFSANVANDLINRLEVPVLVFQG